MSHVTYSFAKYHDGYTYHPSSRKTSYTPQNLVGTPSHKIMNNLSIQKNPTLGQIPIGGKSFVSGKIPAGGKPSLSGQIPTGGKSSFNGKIPTKEQPSFSGKISTGGEPPFIRQIPISTQPMTGGKFQPPFTGNLQQS
jgi:hypothetical protein